MIIKYHRILRQNNKINIESGRTRLLQTRQNDFATSAELLISERKNII